MYLKGIFNFTLAFCFVIYLIMWGAWECRNIVLPIGIKTKDEQGEWKEISIPHR